jgi:NitT/TauT family transport system ATP-binding protein
VGASGCGKSTLLNLLAGLEQPNAGRIHRPAGEATLVFQDGALFPWLTLHRNVDLALRLRGIRRAERQARVAELLRLVHLDQFGDRRPHELSGGMRQRAAVARALAQECPILLMDEPFAALDVITRNVLQDELERIWLETALTVVFVTHNVEEAVRLGDRVIVLSSRPARIAASYEIELPRPRHPSASAELTVAITERLRQEIIGDAPS